MATASKHTAEGRYPNKLITSQFYNFKGLFDRDDSGLIPSDPKTGVFASAILNATCEDGTISFNKGYQAENDGKTLTTHYNVGDNVPILRQFRLKRRDGATIIVAHLGSGKLEWKNAKLNRYETLVVGLAVGATVGMQDFNKTDSDRVYFGDGVGNLSFWNKAVGYYASDNGVDQITLTVDNPAYTTLVAAGFDNTGDDSIVLKDGTQIKYTGITDMTLTGCAAVPASPTVGDGVAQAPDTSSLNSAPVGNIYFVYQGRLGTVIEANPTVMFLSAVADGTDYSTTGAAGFLDINVIDGDGRINAVVPFKNQLVVFKDGGIIPITISLISSTTLQVDITPLILYTNVGPNGANQVSSGVDDIYWVAPSDSDIKQLSRVQTADSIDLSTTPLGTDVRNALKTYDFSNSDILIDNLFGYFTAVDVNGQPAIIEYDALQGTFYFHQVPAASLWRDGSNQIYYTDPNTIQSYQMFSGYDANGSNMSYLWKSGRLNFGVDFYKKEVNVMAVFGLMTKSSVLSYQIDYNNGALSSISGEIKGDGTSRLKSQYMLKVDPSSDYGEYPYGIVPYGGNSSLSAGAQYFLAFIPLPNRFMPYDVFVTFAAQGQANYIKILSFGFNPATREEISKYRKL